MKRGFTSLFSEALFSIDLRSGFTAYRCFPVHSYSTPNNLSPCTAEIVFLRESCMKHIKGKREEKLALSLASSHPVK
jgi:hypothetical protein